jgi:hypothetical protein
MISSFSSKVFVPTAGGLRRILIGAAGVGALGIVVFRLPDWWGWWSMAAVVGAIVVAFTILALALFIALRGSAHAVRRITIEVSLFACALLAAEAVLLARSPENWSESLVVRRLDAQERAARAQGIVYDGRLPSEVVADMRLRGVDAVPGFAQGAIDAPAFASAIKERGLIPLSNASNAVVVECNEGPGYLKFRSDAFGFNNPPGLATGPVDIAVIGESLALGHCVPPATSTVDRLRERFPRTANFGMAGSRVLSQLGVFREYVEPLRPPVVLWFINMNFAQPRHESRRPRLLRYLEDPSFAQGLRERQSEVDAMMRDVAIPLSLERDRALREELDSPAQFPLDRWLKLGEIRRVVGLESLTRRAPVAPNLTHFRRATELVTETAESWGGRVVVVLLPSYEISVEEPNAVVRYEAIARVLEEASVDVVDGPAAFAADPDFTELFTLGIDNHPNERGHAVLAQAIIAALNPGGRS